MARHQAIEESFRVAAQASLEATRKLLIDTAKREHHSVMESDPRPSSFQRFVDGREGASEEDVKANGVIAYHYPRIENVVQYAFEVLFDLSPVLTGAYRGAHTLFIDGRAASDMKGWQPGQEVSISNPLPYSRKIEVGRMKMTVPGTDHVYQQARRKIMARWGNVANIGFTYRGIVEGFNVNPLTAPKGRKPHNRAENRFPALIITER